MRHRKAYNGIQNVIERDTLMVVQCKGKLVAGVTDILQNEVKPLIPRMKRIVIDLSDVTHMDSSGLGTIISLYVSAKSAGCDMRLINLGKRIRELIRIANLLTLFELYGNIPDCRQRSLSPTIVLAVMAMIGMCFPLIFSFRRPDKSHTNDMHDTLR